MTDIISAILLSLGAFFMLVAGVGLVRMPDLFLRMSASTKAATLGVGCTLLGVVDTAFQFGQPVGIASGWRREGGRVIGHDDPAP
ncbi:MAG: hypothetical protein Kow0031_40840 [Anaerolineae bacterium]